MVRELRSTKADRRKAEASRLRKARQRLSEVSWLTGYPLGSSQWRTIASGQPIKDQPLTRRLLIDTERSVSILRNRHHSRLPEILDDPGRWMTGAAKGLAYCKGLIHEQAAMPKSVSTDLELDDHTRQIENRLRKSCPTLAPLLDKLSWTHLLRSQNYRRSLTVISNNSDLFLDLADDDLDKMIRLIQMAYTNGRLDSGLSKTATTKPTSQVSKDRYDQLGKAAKYLLNIAEATKKPPTQDLLILKEIELKKSLPEVEWLALAKSKDRQFVQAIMDLPIKPQDIPLLLADFSPLYDSCLKLCAEISQNPLTPEVRMRAARLGARCKTELDQRSTGQEQVRWRRAMQLLEMKPQHRDQLLAVLRSIFSLDTASTKIQSEQENAESTQPLAIVDTLLKQMTALSPEYRTRWLSILTAHLAEVGLAYIDLILSFWTDAFRVLEKVPTCWYREALHAASKFKHEDDRLLAIDFTVAFKDATVAIERLQTIVDSSYPVYHFDAHWQKIWDLAETSDSFPCLAYHCQNSKLDLDKFSVSLASAGVKFCDLFSFAPKRVPTLLKHFTQASSPCFEPPVRSEPAQWMERYGLHFVAELTLWRSVDPSAEKAAEKVLGRTFANPGKTNRQIAAIEDRIAELRNDGLDNSKQSIHLQKRLDALQAPQKLPSQLDIERLKRKLRQRYRRAAAKFWVESLESRYTQLVRDDLNLTKNDLQSISFDLYSALHEVSATYRDLALSVLRQDISDEPVGYLNHEANTVWLKQAVSHGLNVTPWLNGIGEREVISDAGSVCLDIENASASVMEMGRPFGTCLSPGSFNFWSAIVNAVDVNKTVLVGRNSRGEMVARCLLAIDKQWNILAYHPYRHGDWDFRTVVADYVKDMCIAIGVVNTVRGSVKTVVAPNWYDDDPVDLSGMSEILGKDSELVKQLIVKPDEAVALLERHAIKAEAAVPHLIWKPKINESVPLRRAILQWVPTHCNLALSVWSRLAVLAIEINERSIAEEIVSNQLIGFKDNYEATTDTLQAIAEFRPSLALRLLRNTRATGVRADSEERDKNRIKVLASAHEKLGRVQRAKQLRDLPNQRSGWNILFP